MRNRVIVGITLAGFLALTLRALAHFNYFEFLLAVTANAVLSVLFFDLVISLSLIAAWIARDAKRLGTSPWPEIAITVGLGVAGPLFYLLRRPRQEVAFDVPRAPSRVLLPVLIAFTGATAFAIYRHGYTAFVTYALANEATQLLIVDLTLSLILIAVWMVQDARFRRARVLPHLALAFFFGSVGPLLYLLGRGEGAKPARD